MNAAPRWNPPPPFASMRIARRYLAFEIYRASAVMLLALVGLFTFFAFVAELDSVGVRLSLLDLLTLQVLALPTQVYELLPIALLIGAILALAGLAQRHELVILRVSGVSGVKLLGMLWVITLPIMLIAYALSEAVMPTTEIQSSEATLNLLGKAGGGRMHSGYWFKETDAAGHDRILNIGSLRFGGHVADVTLYEFGPGQELLRFSQSPQGRLADGQLILDRVVQTRITLHAASDLGDAQIPSAPMTRLERLAQRTLPTSLTPERLIARILTPERMAIADLLDYIHYLQNNHLQTGRQVVALWRKLAYPFLLPVMMTIAAPIAFMQTRRGGVGNKVFLGIVLGVGFYMLNQLMLNMGMLGHWMPWVTALAPNLLALALALGALLWMEHQHGAHRFVQDKLLGRRRNV